MVGPAPREESVVSEVSTVPPAHAVEVAPERVAPRGPSAVYPPLPPPVASPPLTSKLERSAALLRPVEVRQARQPPPLPAPAATVVSSTGTEPKAPRVTPTESEVGEGDAAPEPTPKSPLEWMALLRRALSGETESAPAVSRPTGAVARAGPSPTLGLASPPVPEPLSQSSRRFLRPLVGFDPGEVRVHRGVVAAKLTGAVRADAVTAGEDILLGPGHGEDEPGTLGLLAHELTHVARQRVPRFVPPAAAPALPPGAGAPAVPALPAVSPSPVTGATRPVLPPATARPPTAPEEETIALQVEATARRAARAQAEPQGAAGPPLGPASPLGSAPESETGEYRSKRTKPPWGDLPAPWEPLPEFFSRAVESPGTSVPEGPTVPRPARLMSVGAGPPMAAEPAPALQRAAIERSVPEAAAAPDHRPPEHGPPAPDIDALARQVYDVLKRRLAGERRRGG